MSGTNGSMTTTTPSMPVLPEAIERVMIEGDLSQLKPQERLAYYKQVCESLGLNHLTQPFDYIRFQGKLKLYAKRDCTDQLARIYNVTRRIISREIKEGVLVVTCEASIPSGRSDTDIGALTVQGLRGDNLAFAFMKCETKAKRRATLAICGLGWLDETEIEDAADDELDDVPAKPKSIKDLKARHEAAVMATIPAPVAAASTTGSTTPASATVTSTAPDAVKGSVVTKPAPSTERVPCPLTKGCAGHVDHSGRCHDEDGHVLVVAGAVPPKGDDETGAERMKDLVDAAAKPRTAADSLDESRNPDGPEPPMGALADDPKSTDLFVPNPKPEDESQDTAAEWAKVAREILIPKLDAAAAKPHLTNIKKKYAAEWDGVKLNAPEAFKELVTAWNRASDRLNAPKPPKS